MAEDESPQSKTNVSPSEGTLASGMPSESFDSETGATSDEMGDEIGTQVATARLISGRFRLESLIARGGMGAVYRARDSDSNEPVAIKFVQGGVLQGEERFMREAQVLETLEHPNVVRHIAHGRTETKTPYLVMEWLEGESLAQRLAKSRLSLEESLELGIRVCQALSLAHERGVVHRDINPQNLFLTRGDVASVKVLDFGIAQLKFATQQLTQTGSAIGTPGYMAPEQAGSGSAIGGRSDLFSLGCVLFECITGSRAFAGNNLIELLAKVLLDEPPRVRMVQPAAPPELDELVARMMSKDSENRPDSAAEVAASLKAIADDLASGTGSAPRSRRSITAAENRLISVLVADNAMGNVTGTDEHELDELLVELADKFSAKIDKLGNGSLIATLVGQGDATDQASRAARFALSMRDLVGRVPMALATGQGSLHDDKPVGPAIDRATTSIREAGLGEPDAEPGRSPIIIDQVTAGLLDARFEVRKHEGNLTLQGVHQSREPVRTVLGTPTTCVGRHRELASLEAAYHQVLDESMAHANLVIAEPGFGKTRLRQELLKRFARHETAPQVWFAQGNPVTSGSAFELVQQMFTNWLNLSPADSLPTKQQKLRIQVERHAGRDLSARITAFLGELVGVEFPDHDDIQLRAARLDPVLKGDQITRAVEDLIAKLASEQPQVFIIDDLQWGDFPTLRLIDGMLRNSSDKQVMVIGFGRPEIAELFPGLWQRRGVSELRLTPLAPRARRKLIREVLGTRVEESTVQRLSELSSGNALWLEELLRAEATEQVSTPETVVVMAQSRLGRLDPVPRQVLRAASVFGTRFWKGATRSLVSALVDREFESTLSELAEQEITIRRRTSRFPDETEWEFSNSLLREAAYASLTDDDRQLAHRLAAEWLAAAGEADALCLARHWVSGGKPELAVPWFLKAAEEALQGNDFVGVLEFSKSGLDSGPNQEERARLHLIRSTAFKWLGNNADAQHAAAESMGAAEGGSAVWCDAVGEAAVAAGKLGDAKTLVLLTRVLMGSEPKPQAQDAHAVAMSRMASQLVFASELELAETLTNKVSKMVSGYNSGPEVMAWFYEARAVHAGSRGDLATRLRLAEAAAESFETSGDMRNASLQRVSAGYACNELGAFAEATRTLSTALGWATRMGVGNSAAIAKLQLGRAELGLGELDTAENHIREAIQSLDAQNNQRLAGTARTYLAQTLLEKGDAEAAKAAASEAVATLKEVPALLPNALAALAMTQMATGQSEAALETTSRATADLEGPGKAGFGTTLVHFVHCEALQSNGRTEDAREALKRAIEGVQSRAELISEATHRKSFLREPTNARVFSLAKRWGIL